MKPHTEAGVSHSNDFVEIIEMLDKRLNDKGKNWRHVFKSLTLLDYCLHAGSENTVQYFRYDTGLLGSSISDVGADQRRPYRSRITPLPFHPVMYDIGPMQ